MNKETYHFTLSTGQEIKVTYFPKWTYQPEYNFRVDHLVFRGDAISKTGFKSHFTMVKAKYNPTKDELKHQIKKLIENFSGIKFDEQYQRVLF